MTKPNLLEVLAPAGSPECFMAALNSGADAIYLGISAFNARMKAENFSEDNIRHYISLAHTHGVKIYITVNTLLEDDDFDELIKTVKFLTEAKADAFIVQDYGVAYVLKNCFDNIVLHASTQMGIHNLEGAKFAEKLGFSRIVLSRETKLEDIKAVRKNTKLEIEYFVQGALCVAFSGNCYLSSIEKNLSGNEGKCLQLCRLPVTNNQTNQTKYYLSARDLSLLSNLEALIDAGVTSFKIEGRMRHAGYVATATSTYKSALALALNHNLSADKINMMATALTRAFSRGDYNTSAYLNNGVTDNIIFPDYQNHIGQKIGKVISVAPFKNDLFKITIKSSHTLSAGDGLKIIDPKTKTQVCSLGVGNVEQLNKDNYIFYTKHKFASGLDVHLTLDYMAEQKLLNHTRKTDLFLKITANAGTKMHILATANNTTITLESPEVLEPAKTSPLSVSDFELQLSKLSDTPFVLKDLTLDTDGVFIPKSSLNSIRRLLTQKLLEALLETHEQHITASYTQNSYQTLKNKTATCQGKNLTIVSDLKHLSETDKTSIIIYSPSNYLQADILQALQVIKPENFALNIPTILNSKDMQLFNQILTALPKNIYLYANNIAGLEFALLGYNVIASPLVNIKNKFACMCLNTHGIKHICSSIEADINFATRNHLIWFYKGEFPLMTFAHCPYKTIHNTTCKACKFNNSLTYTSTYGKTYKIVRTKISNCYFTLNTLIDREPATYNLYNKQQY